MAHEAAENAASEVNLARRLEGFEGLRPKTSVLKPPTTNGPGLALTSS